MKSIDQLRIDNDDVQKWDLTFRRLCACVTALPDLSGIAQWINNLHFQRQSACAETAGTCERTILILSTVNV